MAIYSRFGSEVEFIRLAAPEDVKAIEKRKSDKHDRDRIALGCYIVGRFIDNSIAKDDLRIFDIGMLKADGGWKEIHDRAVAVGSPLNCG